VRKKTYAEIKEFVEQNSDCELLSDHYEGTFEPLRFRCRCGNEFTASWHKFSNQNRRQCLDCAMKQRANKRRNSLPYIKQKLLEAGYEYISGDYKDHKSKITIRCKCGHPRTMIYSNIFQEGFLGLCNDCAAPRQHGSNRLTIDEIREMSASRGLELLSTEYKTARSKLRFRCECGEEFETTWDSVYSKNKVRCDKCSWKMSTGERAIQDWLDENGFEYEREKAFPGLIGPTGRGYRFDFFIPSKNLCIEFDGQQHYKIVNYSGKEDLEKLTVVFWATKLRDAQKTQYCEAAGIDLLRISFEQIDDVPSILTDKLIPREDGEPKDSVPCNA
jgi:hypothetical protein